MPRKGRQEKTFSLEFLPAGRRRLTWTSAEVKISHACPRYPRTTPHPSCLRPQPKVLGAAMSGWNLKWKRLGWGMPLLGPCPGAFPLRGTILQAHVSASSVGPSAAQPQTGQRLSHTYWNAIRGTRGKGCEAHLVPEPKFASCWSWVTTCAPTTWAATTGLVKQEGTRHGHRQPSRPWPGPSC